MQFPGNRYNALYKMRRKEVFVPMILRHDDFCMSPGAFNGIGTCATFKILEGDRMINLQMFITLISEKVSYESQQSEMIIVSWRIQSLMMGINVASSKKMLTT